jgi:uracil-DNA glycosylase family 4
VAGKTKLPVFTGNPAVAHPDIQGGGKPSIICGGCDLFHKERFTGSGAPGQVDVMFVSESPSQWTVKNNAAFSGRGGSTIKRAWKDLGRTDTKTGALRVWWTYAVQCQVEEGREQSGSASTSTIARCSNFLNQAILVKRPKVIIALGATALKSLGYRAEKFTDVRGRILEHEISGHRFSLVVTFGTKAVLSQTGLFHLLTEDLKRAARLATGVDEIARATPIEELTKNYVFPKTVQEVKDLCDHIINYVVPGAPSAQKCFLALDTETNTLYPHRADAKVLCLSVAWDTGKATAIPLFHPQATWTPDELSEVLAHVRRMLECPKPKVLHNSGFDLRFLELRHGLKVNNVQWDTMLGEHLLHEDLTGAYSLKTLGRNYFPEFSNYADKVGEIAATLTEEEQETADAIGSVKKGKIKNRLGLEDMTGEMTKAQVDAYILGDKKLRKKRANDAGYERVPLDTLLPYAAIDTDLTRRLLRNQYGRIKDEGCQKTASLMKSHCIPAARVLGKMEFLGFPVDREHISVIEEQLTKVVEAKMNALRGFWDATIAFKPDKKGEEFNPNSTKQIEFMLFSGGVVDPEHPKYDDKGNIIPDTREGPWCEKNEKSGQFKTDKKTLKAVAEKKHCPFAKALLEYRAAHKALTGFVQEIKVLSEYDGRVHTNFNIHGTATGRLSSRSINLQNLPTKKVAGTNIKKIFIPDNPNEELVFNVDWKGAEIRVLTAYARDPELERALQSGLDIHSWFTQEVFGIPYEEVEAKKETDDKIKDTRLTIKRVVFGTLYGAMAKKIAETASISQDRAQEIIDKLYARFPALAKYMDEVVGQIHRNGYVETLFGRRRRFPLFNVSGFFKGRAERMGKNMKIQSTSSDIVIGQLCEVDEHISELGGRLCITVHDSIVGTIRKDMAHRAGAFFQKYCVDRVRERYPWLPVDFACDITVGPNYGEQIPLQDWLDQRAPAPSTEDKEFFEELDHEAVKELREDEDEARNRERMEQQEDARREAEAS